MNIRPPVFLNSAKNDSDFMVSAVCMMAFTCVSYLFILMVHCGGGQPFVLSCEVAFINL